MGYIQQVSAGPRGLFFRHFGCRVSILAILVLNRVQFQHSSLELGKFLGRSYLLIVINKAVNKSRSKLMFRATAPAATVVNRALNCWSGHKQGSKNCRNWSYIEYRIWEVDHTSHQTFLGVPSPTPRVMERLFQKIRVNTELQHVTLLKQACVHTLYLYLKFREHKLQEEKRK